MAVKSLDQKLAFLRQNPGGSEFIIADAKDGDMAYGISAPGRSPEHHSHEARFRSLDEYRELIRQNTRQGLIDIMLMSAGTNEVLTIQERLFQDSPITPAIRANDTTDIWLAGSGRYADTPSRPFRSASLDQAMCGRPLCGPDDPMIGADLGLYSVTFNHDTESDLRTLKAYKAFREEAEKKGFRHFLEVFEPNAPANPVVNVGRYLNDMIVRTLAGVAGGQRPLFLKVPYLGPAAMEELAGYDSSLIVGILGGSAGTTFDAFHQLWEAKKYGARVALYGRMINNSEHQLLFIEHLRAIADGQIGPADAVRSYHGALQNVRIKPHRSLEDDLKQMARSGSYSSGTAPATASASSVGVSQSTGEPDFDSMTPAEKIEWNLQRWDRTIGTTRPDCNEDN